MLKMQLLNVIVILKGAEGMQNALINIMQFFHIKQPIKILQIHAKHFKFTEILMTQHTHSSLTQLIHQAELQPIRLFLIEF